MIIYVYMCVYNYTKEYKIITPICWLPIVVYMLLINNICTNHVHHVMHACGFISDPKHW